MHLRETAYNGYLELRDQKVPDRHLSEIDQLLHDQSTLPVKQHRSNFQTDLMTMQSQASRPCFEIFPSHSKDFLPRLYHSKTTLR
jgi:hypothetical protein